MRPCACLAWPVNWRISTSLLQASILLDNCACAVLAAYSFSRPPPASACACVTSVASPARVAVRRRPEPSGLSASTISGTSAVTPSAVSRVEFLPLFVLHFPLFRVAFLFLFPLFCRSSIPQSSSPCTLCSVCCFLSPANAWRTFVVTSQGPSRTAIARKRFFGSWKFSGVTVLQKTSTRHWLEENPSVAP